MIFLEATTFLLNCDQSSDFFKQYDKLTNKKHLEEEEDAASIQNTHISTAPTLLSKRGSHLHLTLRDPSSTRGKIMVYHRYLQ